MGTMRGPAWKAIKNANQIRDYLYNTLFVIEILTYNKYTKTACTKTSYRRKMKNYQSKLQN